MDYVTQNIVLIGPVIYLRVIFLACDVKGRGDPIANDNVNKMDLGLVHFRVKVIF